MQNHYIPYITSIEEISRKLQNGELERWEIDPKEQSPGNPNTRISFFGKDGKLYLVTAQYNLATNQIFPSVRVIPKGKLAEPQLINWEETSKIFNLGTESNNITPNIPNSYCDSEIDGKVSPDYFNPIFQAIDSFQPEVYRFYFRRIDTDQSALIKQWTSKDARLEFWIAAEGLDTLMDVERYAIIFGAPNTFLIVGNFSGHPFVQTPDFTFDNSDGFTDDDFPNLKLDQVKDSLKIKAMEYIFNQIH